MIIEKYTMPTNFDVADYGARWRVIGQDEEEVYIQLSKDKNNPSWFRFGSFLETSFSHLLNHERFIEDCLELFDTNHAKPSIDKIIDSVRSRD